jgi:phage shock protein PspC (stress-responsive transcriptional regulator)
MFARAIYQLVFVCLTFFAVNEQIIIYISIGDCLTNKEDCRKEKEQLI